MVNKNTLREQVGLTIRFFGCRIAVNDLLTEPLLFDASKRLNDHLQNMAKCTYATNNQSINVDLHPTAAPIPFSAQEVL